MARCRHRRRRMWRAWQQVCAVTEAEPWWVQAQRPCGARAARCAPSAARTCTAHNQVQLRLPPHKQVRYPVAATCSRVAMTWPQALLLIAASSRAERARRQEARRTSRGSPPGWAGPWRGRAERAAAGAVALPGRPSLRQLVRPPCPAHKHYVEQQQHAHRAVVNVLLAGSSLAHLTQLACEVADACFMQGVTIIAKLFHLRTEKREAHIVNQQLPRSAFAARNTAPAGRKLWRLSGGGGGGAAEAVERSGRCGANRAARVQCKPAEVLRRLHPQGKSS